MAEGILRVTPPSSFSTSLASIYPPSTLLSTMRASNSIVVPLLFKSSPSCAFLSSALFGKDARSAKALSDFRLGKHRSLRRTKLNQLQVRSAAGPDDGIKWWEKDGAPNMMDVHSAKELVDAVTAAGEKLVIVEFFATWCGSCRALYPKLCKLAAEHTDVVFLKVNFDENKPLCKSLEIKVLPYFHLYRGANGRLDTFSCSLSKLQRLRDAIATHNTARCSLGPPVGLGAIDSTGSVVSNTLDQPATAGSAR